MANLLSSVLAANALKDNVGILVLKKAMDVKKQNSEDLLGILQKISPPHLGNNIDISA